jgi:MYXO-CTERM domain-containing protein
MQLHRSARDFGLGLSLAIGAVVSAQAGSTPSVPASYTYEFKTYYDESTALNLFDTKSFAASVATLTVTDIAGGVQLTLKANTTAFPAKTSAGNFIEELWFDSGSGKLNLTSSNTSLTSSSGYNWLGTTPKIGHSFDWDLDFKSATFAEGETATLTLLGSGINARALVKGDLPMLLLGNVGHPFGTLSGNAYFVASHPTAVPEASTYAMAALGLAGLGVWSRRKKA